MDIYVFKTYVAFNYNEYLMVNHMLNYKIYVDKFQMSYKRPFIIKLQKNLHP